MNSVVIHIGNNVNTISISDKNNAYCLITWNLNYNVFANVNNYNTDIFDRFYNAKINNSTITVEFN